MQTDEELSAVRATVIGADFNGFLVSEVIDGYLKQVAESAVRSEARNAALQDENVRLSRELERLSSEMQQISDSIRKEISLLDGRVDELTQLIIKTATALAMDHAPPNSSDESHQSRTRRPNLFGS
ncbi:hypothetical protein GEOBRER4_n2824 [Citrifermentans bremense]|uniref:Uncharacterized protein n=1 Tax=Citrifermentans bremense TaxID=60035 RepID=A0A6S6M7Z5_9BACT|nr:hypothetical protein [Citrifermentans bremense]BCG47966.1 hypothetical protein GEOBRER4_n2824 [Citrifermentans bremense]